MGRLIGDGRFYLFIVDVVVRTDIQAQGIGRRIVAALEAAARELSLTGRVNLIATAEMAGFYEHLGFVGNGSVFMEKRWQLRATGGRAVIVLRPVVASPSRCSFSEGDRRRKFSPVTIRRRH